MPRKIEISHRTIVFTVFFLIGLWFLYYIKDIILELFVALLLATILEPVVNFLAKVKIPRGMATFLSYIIFFGIFGLAISFILPPLIDETTSFVAVLPSYLSNLGVGEAVSNNLTSEFLTKLGALPGEVIKITLSLFSNLISVLTVLVFSFYILLSRGKLDDTLGFFFGEDKKKELSNVIETLETRLGGWARGQIVLMISVGIVTYIGLALLGVPYAFPLAMLAGILEIVPFLGPIIAAIPSLIIGFGISPAMGIGTVIVAFLVQQVENYVLVPKIMEKSVGVSPIITLIALAIGARLAGVVGMIISVPTVIAFQVFSKHYFLKE